MKYIKMHIDLYCCSNLGEYHFIKNELLTLKEFDKIQKRVGDVNSMYYDVIEISSHKTHYMFGARFLNK